MKNASWRTSLWLVLLAGCAGRNSTVPHDFCAAARPITIEDADGLTDATAKQIEDHNQKGVDWCGW